MKFITLGPTGSNHEFVTRRYLEFHGIAGHATLELARDFEVGASAVMAGHADFLAQCAVHPDTSRTVARWFDGLYAIDTFISPSQDLAILRRRDATTTRCLAVMRPTLDYIDRSRWDRIEPVDTVAEVTEGLVSGKYAEGLGYASIAQTRPDLLQVTEFIGTVDDAWIVYGCTRLSHGRITAWRDSAAGLLFRKGELA